MNLIYSIIAGAIQGLTEFLPISSSGHLVLLHEYLNFDLSNNLAFDVVLHLGTLVALLIFFWQDVLYLLKSFFKSFVRRDITDPNQRLSWQLLLATIPAVLAGYFFEDIIDLYFRNILSVALMLILFGGVLYLADRYFSKVKTIPQLSLFNAIVIGIAQVLALVPGVSRSGITIIAGLGQKLNRGEAARFSFLMAIPVVFGAGAKKVYDFSAQGGINNDEILVLILGFITAAITGYLCIKYFLQFLQNHSLQFFAYYRIILGLILLGVVFFG